MMLNNRLLLAFIIFQFNCIAQKCIWKFEEDKIKISLTIHKDDSDSTFGIFTIENYSQRKIGISEKSIILYSLDSTTLKIGFGITAVNRQFSDLIKIEVIKPSETYQVTTKIISTTFLENLDIRFDYSYVDNSKLIEKNDGLYITKKKYFKYIEIISLLIKWGSVLN